MRKKEISFAILAFCVIIVFFPLFFGFHFLQIDRFKGYLNCVTQEDNINILEDKNKNIRARFPLVSLDEPNTITLCLPQDFFTGREIRKGKIPLWSSFSGCGTPTFELGQYKPFNPFKIPFYVSASYFTYCLGIFLFFVYGIVGSFLMFRSFNLTKTSALLGTLFIFFNEHMVDIITFYSAEAVFTFPWILYALRKSFCKEDSFRWKVLLSLNVFLLFHSAHIETAFLSFLSALLLFLTEKIELRTILKKVGTISLPVTISFIGSSVLLIPLIDYLLRADLYKKMGGIHLTNLRIDSFLFVSSHTFVLPSVVVILFFSLFRIKKAKVLVPLIMICVILILLLPIPSLKLPLVNRLEYMTGLNPHYLVDILFILIGYVSSFSFNVLCALKKKNYINWALIFGTGLFIVTFLLHLFKGATLKSQMRFPEISFLFIIFSLAIIFFYKRFNLFREKPEIVVLAIMLPYIYPLSLNHIYWSNFEPKTGELVEKIKRDYPYERVASIRTETNMFIAPNLGEEIEIRQPELSSAIFPNEYYKRFHKKNTWSTVILFDKTNLKDILETGAKIVVYPKNEKPPFKGNVFFKDEVFEAMYLNEGSGRVFLVDRIGDNNELENLKLCGSAKIVYEENENLKIEAISERDCFLILKDTYDKNWKCYIDKVETPVMKIDGCFMGFSVPEGRHCIELKYKPVLTIFTLFISVAIGLTLFLIVAAITLRDIFNLIIKDWKRRS